MTIAATLAWVTRTVRRLTFERTFWRTNGSSSESADSSWTAMVAEAAAAASRSAPAPA